MLGNFVYVQQVSSLDNINLRILLSLLPTYIIARFPFAAELLMDRAASQNECNAKRPKSKLLLFSSSCCLWQEVAPESCWSTEMVRMGQCTFVCLSSLYGNDAAAAWLIVIKIKIAIIRLLILDLTWINTSDFSVAQPILYMLGYFLNVLPI